MAKYEARIKGDFEKVLSKLEKGLLSSSKTITLQEKSDFQNGNNRCSVRVFTYSPLIRAGAYLNLTLFHSGKDYIELSAISNGGFSFLPIKDGEQKIIEEVQKILQNNFKQ